MSEVSCPDKGEYKGLGNKNRSASGRVDILKEFWDNFLSWYGIKQASNLFFRLLLLELVLSVLWVSIIEGGPIDDNLILIVTIMTIHVFVIRYSLSMTTRILACGLRSYLLQPDLANFIALISPEVIFLAAGLSLQVAVIKYVVCRIKNRSRDPI